MKEKLDKKWKWTRVQNIEEAVMQPVTSVDVLQDLEGDMTLKMIRKSAVNELGVLMFDPEAYNDQKSLLTIARYRLGREELLDYAKMASRIRYTISRSVASLADEHRDPGAEHDLNQLLNSRASAEESAEVGQSMMMLGWNPSHPARKRLSMHQLSSAKRLEIVKRAASKQ